MTIPEHIEILRRGPRVWNAWRDENPSIVPDLAGVALSIGDRQMGPISGGPINLSRALLSEAALYYATLTGADLRGSDLKNADLRGARLEGVDLTGANLAGAQLDGASLNGAVLKAANLSGASLDNVADLTADQIGEAEGDLGTVLPSDLEHPLVWMGCQGLAQIEITHSAAEEHARQDDREDDPVEERVESAAIAHRAEAHQAVEPGQDAEANSHDDGEWIRHSMASGAAGAVEAEQPITSEPEPVVTQPVDAPTPVLPKVEPNTLQPASEQNGSEQRVNREAARPGGHEVSDGDEQDSGENKHVSWLVGGPRQAGRPTRNWRDRA